jgi:hypothetical protein
MGEPGPETVTVPRIVPGQWIHVSGALGGMASSAGWDDDCRYCGYDLGDPYADDWDDPYTCPHCSAPTPQWWARLDQMIADWKRGQRGN